MRERRTAEDCARVLKELATVYFSEAEKIVLVRDNLNRTLTMAYLSKYPCQGE